MNRKFVNYLRTRYNKAIHLFLGGTNLYPISHVKERDVFIIGYPKSGNTWISNLIAGALFGIDTQFLPDKLTKILVPSPLTKFYNRILDFTCFSSHDMPDKRFKRVIHLVRDGRDVMASYFAYSKNLGYSSDIYDFMAQIGNNSHGKWHEHTEAWIDNPYNADLIRVKYEDIINKPLDSLRNICDFLEIERPDDLLNRCISGNSFAQMQRKERVFGFFNKKWPSEKPFFRKGKIGSYATELPISAIEQFEAESKHTLEKLGYSLFENPL